MTVLKAIGPPGSVTFIAFCCLIGVGLAYVWPRRPGLTRAWLLFVFAMHLAMALPLVANTIADGLPDVHVSDATALRNLETVFVLDGDNRRGRVRSAIEAANASPSAAVVILGGSYWLINALSDGGIPTNRITHDHAPADTRQQIEDLERIIGQRPGASAIVASRLQMPRVAGLARKAGLSAALVASPIDTEPPTSGWRVLVPSYYALRVSRDAIYEHAALAYYVRKGWIRTAAE